MCVVSMIHDWGRTQPWMPQEGPYWNPPYKQEPALVPDEDIIKKYKEFLDLMKAAEEFDKKTKQKECTDDRKDRLIKQLKDLIKEYEK